LAQTATGVSFQLVKTLPPSCVALCREEVDAASDRLRAAHRRTAALRREHASAERQQCRERAANWREVRRERAERACARQREAALEEERERRMREEEDDKSALKNSRWKNALNRLQTREAKASSGDEHDDGGDIGASSSPANSPSRVQGGVLARITQQLIGKQEQMGLDCRLETMRKLRRLKDRAGRFEIRLQSRRAQYSSLSAGEKARYEDLYKRFCSDPFTGILGAKEVRCCVVEVGLGGVDVDEQVAAMKFCARAANEWRPTVVEGQLLSDPDLSTRGVDLYTFAVHTVPRLKRLLQNMRHSTIDEEFAIRTSVQQDTLRMEECAGIVSTILRETVDDKDKRLAKCVADVQRADMEKSAHIDSGSEEGFGDSGEDSAQRLSRPSPRRAGLTHQPSVNIDENVVQEELPSPKLLNRRSGRRHCTPLSLPDVIFEVAAGASKHSSDEGTGSPKLTRASILARPGASPSRSPSKSLLNHFMGQSEFEDSCKGSFFSGSIGSPRSPSTSALDTQLTCAQVEQVVAMMTEQAHRERHQREWDCQVAMGIDVQTFRFFREDIIKLADCFKKYADKNGRLSRTASLKLCVEFGIETPDHIEAFSDGQTLTFQDFLMYTDKVRRVAESASFDCLLLPFQRLVSTVAAPSRAKAETTSSSICERPDLPIDGSVLTHLMKLWEPKSPQETLALEEASTEHLTYQIFTTDGLSFRDVQRILQRTKERLAGMKHMGEVAWAKQHGFMEEELVELHDAFTTIDKDANGVLDLDEVWEAVTFMDLSLSWNVSNAIFNQLVEKGKGGLTFPDFLKFLKLAKDRKAILAENRVIRSLKELCRIELLHLLEDIFGVTDASQETDMMLCRTLSGLTGIDELAPLKSVIGVQTYQDLFTHCTNALG